jgi:hypothetical protein
MSRDPTHTPPRRALPLLQPPARRDPMGPAYIALRDGLRRFIRRRAHESHVDGLVQEVFLRMQEHAGELREDERIARVGLSHRAQRRGRSSPTRSCAGQLVGVLGQLEHHQLRGSRSRGAESAETSGGLSTARRAGAPWSSRARLREGRPGFSCRPPRQPNRSPERRLRTARGPVGSGSTVRDSE